MARGKFLSNLFSRFIDFLMIVIKGIYKAVSFLFKKFNDANISPDIKKRIVSGAILVVVALYAILFAKGLFLFLAICAAFLATLEWIDVTKEAKDQRRWRIIGFLAIVIPLYSVVQVREYSVEAVLWLFGVIWATDVFAFVAGKYFGGLKLAPKISPNKTWSGLLGGVFASMIIGFISSFMFASGNIRFFMTASILLAILEQSGDLFESKWKRVFGVKDSGTLIPGHGGLLDRLDGLLFVAPTVLLLLWAYPEKFLLN